MPTKRYKSEQIVTLLRQIEVEIAKEKRATSTSAGKKRLFCEMAGQCVHDFRGKPFDR